MAEDRGVGLKGWLSGPRSKERKTEARTHKSVPLDRHRVAVLPFANVSPDPNDEYFADGMTEEMISTISNISNLSVISRTSVMQYKGAKRSLPEIGAALNAGTVLEGSVRKAGNQVRITVQLLDAVEDKHLWAQSYDRMLEDVFAIQSDVAERVARALQVKVLGVEKDRLQERASRNSGALTLYLKGRSAIDQGNEPGIRKAIEFYQKSIEQDPDFALAYVGVAECYYWLAGDYISMDEGLGKAKENLDKALFLNPELGEAHSLLGLWLRNQLRWDEAETALKKALRLSPGFADTHARYAGLLIATGKLDEALLEARKAVELDPLAPRQGWRVGQVYYYMRKYDKAIEQFRDVLQMAPRYHEPLIWMSFAYIGKSLQDEALEVARQWYERVGDMPSNLGFNKGLLACIFRKTGHTEEARKLFAEAEQAQKTSPTGYAYWQTFNGNIDLAFEYLEQARKERDPILFDIKVDPLWDPLRPDPRYKILLEELHLA